jgi:hypothetical protein
MVSNGELPWGADCAYSGRQTSDRLDLVIECEGPDRGPVRGGYLVATMASLFFGVIGRVLAEIWRDTLPANVRARLVVVRVPLLVRSQFHDKVRAMRSQRRLRGMLRTVPIYGELLTQYPKAKIIVLGGPIR